MADETETKPAQSDFIAPGMKSVDPVLLTKDDGAVNFAPASDFVVETENLPAAARLRAFEDEHFPDAVRIREQIEKGSGSPFQMAAPAIRTQHAALEKLIEAEAKLAAAHTALIVADTDYEAALAATEPKPDAAASE